MRSSRLAASVLLRAGVILLALGFPGFPVRAQPSESIGIILAEDSASYREVAESIHRTLDQEAPGHFRISIITAANLSDRAGEALKSDSGLIVTVGVAAATAMADVATKSPVLNTLIPRVAFEKLQANRPPGSDGRTSAIYLDQPATRIMDLARLTVPKSSHVGVIFGPESAAYAKPYERAARQLGLTLEVETIATAEEIPGALERVLGRSNVLLAAPDPNVYSRSTLQGILLSAYRANSPVIGFSSAYVRAGALAAVYSTPDQIGRQAAELIVKFGAGGRWQLPPPQNPKYFSVEVNRNVARSLGLALDEDSMLLERLKRSGGSES